ncbi:hypothetical protein A9Q99_13860 [Gammaproteobacteria bacterium 45_16_T64]|nr:hypothetical protein A9Q99_13860 [Gammaproteobacteria bacterium 45_16_T64]
MELFHKGKKILNSWGVMQWAIILVVLVLCSHKVFKRQSTRIQQASQENVAFLEQDIQEFNSMAERLGQMEELPPVRSQWAYVSAIADEFGVILSRKDGGRGEYYKGPLASWDGSISGSPGTVLVTADAFQQTVPTFLYELSISKGKATLNFAVLGGQ